jgi:hypothetical protein
MPAGLLQVRLQSVSLLNEPGDSALLAISAAEPLAADCERVLGTDQRGRERPQLRRTARLAATSTTPGSVIASP